MAANLWEVFRKGYAHNEICSFLYLSNCSLNKFTEWLCRQKKARTRSMHSSFGLSVFYPVGKIPSRIVDGKGLVGWIRVTPLSGKN